MLMRDNLVNWGRWQCNLNLIQFELKKERTDQSEEDEEELDDVSVGHGVQSAEERVEDGDQGRHYDADGNVDIDDDGNGRTFNRRHFIY